MDSPTPPRVFISYSHDSAEHKKWVLDFASTLRKNGVDVILDQWGLTLGDDVPKFMEHSLVESDRVLMICTPAYVHRANDGKGGVGYEAMIVTGQFVKDLGTTKFIPILRQGEGQCELPTSVSTRFYIDLSEHNSASHKDQLDTLLRELHKAPVNPMPPIGKSPYATGPSGRDLPKAQMDEGAEIIKMEAESPEGFYQQAFIIAKSGDVLAWRHLVRKARNSVEPVLKTWRQKYDTTAVGDMDSLLNQSLDGIEAFSPLFCMALAGIGSGRSDFTNQSALIDIVLHPDSWNMGGPVIVTAIPEAAVFVYQALSGAMYLYTGQYGPAINMVRTKVQTPMEREPSPLWSHHELIGWPKSFHNSSTAWAALLSLPDRWPWLLNVFASKGDYSSALVAFYLFLNINEYAYTLAEGKEGALSNDDTHLEVPLAFMETADSARREAYTLLSQNLTALSDVWRSLKVSDERFCEHWNTWMTLCRSWHSRSKQWGSGSGMPHARLASDIAN